MKILLGLGLVVTGGAMVIGSATAGFLAGAALVTWSIEQDKKPTVDKATA